MKEYTRKEVEELLRIRRELIELGHVPRDMLGLPQGIRLEHLLKMRDILEDIMPVKTIKIDAHFKPLYDLIEKYKKLAT